MYLNIFIALFSFVIGLKTFIEKGLGHNDKPFLKKFSFFDKIIIIVSFIVLALTISKIIKDFNHSDQQESRDNRIDLGVDTIKSKTFETYDIVDTTFKTTIQSQSKIDAIEKRTSIVLNERNRLIKEFQNINNKLRDIIQKDKLSIAENSAEINIIDPVSWVFDDPSFKIGIRVIFTNTGHRSAIKFSPTIEYYELDSNRTIVDNKFFRDSYNSETIITPLVVSQKKCKFDYIRFTGEKNNINRIPSGAIIKVNYQYLDEIIDKTFNNVEYFYWTQEHNQKTNWRDAPDFVIEFVNNYNKLNRKK